MIDVAETATCVPHLQGVKHFSFQNAMECALVNLFQHKSQNGVVQVAIGVAVGAWRTNFAFPQQWDSKSG
jgi:hypothetical protein